MATYYVKSTAAGAGTGADWTNAYTTLSAAMSGKAAGDTFYVSNHHAESTASAVTLTSPGTQTSPCWIYCVSDAAIPPTALATTATISTTGANSITLLGMVGVCYGITFQAGDSSNSASINLSSSGTTGLSWNFDTCVFSLTNTNTGSQIVFGVISAVVIQWRNVTCKFGSNQQNIVARVPFVWTGGSIDPAGQAPVLLINPITTAQAVITGVDFSALGSGCALVRTNTAWMAIDFQRCKLGASVGILSGTIAGQGYQDVRLSNCDSANTNYRYYRQNFFGSISHETTIVRTGGASDGTTAISRKMVSTANTTFGTPLETDNMIVWNEITGSSITCTCEIVNDGTTLKDSEVWLEEDYLGTSGYPLGVITSDRAADIFATGVSQTSSSVTWTTTGLTTPIKQKLQVTVTPQVKGPIRLKVKLAKASTTIYICPKIEVS